jgi:hypothetical protein
LGAVFTLPPADFTHPPAIFNCPRAVLAHPRVFLASDVENSSLALFTYVKPEFFIIRALCQLLNSIRVFSLDFLVDKKLYFFQVYAICRHPLSISLHKVFFNKTFIEAKIRILEGFLDGTDPSS